MKKFAVILLAGLILPACSAEKALNDSKANTAGNKAPVQSPANAAPSVSPPDVPGERTGEKVADPSIVDFRNGLPQGWTKLDPESEKPSGFETGANGLKLRIPSGKDLYGENRTAPRLVKNITGDFEVETRLNFNPTADYQGAGLIIFRNDSNFLRLERGFGGVGGGGGGIRFDRAEDESYDGVATPEKFPTNSAAVDLKLRREGRIVTAFWREAGKSDWIEVGRVANTYPETVVVGLIGVNTDQEITAEFSYIKLAPIKKP